VRGVVELHPLNPGPRNTLGILLLAQGDPAGALLSFDKGVELDPGSVWNSFWRPSALLLAGRAEEACAAFDRITEKGLRLAGLAMAYHSLGRDADSRRALDDLEACCAACDGYKIADVHAWRGDKDAALRWLERSRDQHDAGVTFLKYDPLMQRLRGDPRLAAFLASVRLPPDR